MKVSDPIEQPLSPRMLTVGKASTQTDVVYACLDRKAYPMSLPTIDDLKQQARRLRTAMAARGAPIAHGAALEILAQQHGQRDWNTLAARLRVNETPPSGPPVAVGDAVRGRYLNQPFAGRVIALSALAGDALYRIVIHFDQPVDVVTFDSFSALRQRISAQIDAAGISPRKTSNGLPQLVLEL